MELKELLMGEISGRYLTSPIPLGLGVGSNAYLEFISEHAIELNELFTASYIADMIKADTDDTIGFLEDNKQVVLDYLNNN